MIRRFIFLLSALLPQVVSASGMTSKEVSLVLSQAISRAQQIEPHAVIAVVDREGFVLGVWRVDSKMPRGLKLHVAALDAITKAGTAAFLSSDQHAFTSRTAGFIVQQHFPPGVVNRPNGPLVGVNFSNQLFTDVNRFKNPNKGRSSKPISGVNGAPITIDDFAALSGLAGSPGGVPLYRDGKLIGGVGVAGKTRANEDSPFSILADIQPQSQQVYDPDEDVALAGQTGFRPKAAIVGSDVAIDGIRVPYVVGGTRLGKVRNLGSVGKVYKAFLSVDSPRVAYDSGDFGGQVCEIRADIIDDPMIKDNMGGDPIDNSLRLTAKQVTKILSQASARAKITRAGIRLPRGQAAQTFITVVNNPGLKDVPPTILGTIRTPDATIFSWDVSAQKARTAVFFSDDTRAFSSRTVGFLSQQFFPPGIANTAPGPFYKLQERYSRLPDKVQNFLSPEPKYLAVVNPLNRVQLSKKEAMTTTNPYLPNGITIFPGGFPLYRKGVLVGAIGVSGDGIDQDDIIAAAGTVGFDAPDAIRADRQEYQGARLPYAKFPRNPDL